MIHRSERDTANMTHLSTGMARATDWEPHDLDTVSVLAISRYGRILLTSFTALSILLTIPAYGDEVWPVLLMAVWSFAPKYSNTGLSEYMSLYSKIVSTVVSSYI